MNGEPTLLVAVPSLALAVLVERFVILWASTWLELTDEWFDPVFDLLKDREFEIVHNYTERDDEMTFRQCRVVCFEILTPSYC
ncbi:MAG: hypothetical protein ABS81_07220 [Pseudonocardia sp. SCN 72-86]|nr:MAG: hypothetical protein ABS81_07220 [Pseudonocardia sp. SCN 72-86]